MDRRTRRGLNLAALAAVAFACVASGGQPVQRGVFALLGATPKIVSDLSTVRGSGDSVTLKIRQFLPGGKTPILRYDTDMEKLMHIVIVRDDFATFAHVHPSFDPQTGVFTRFFTGRPHHRYYVYADTTPTGIGHQVFRFTLGNGTAPAHVKPLLAGTTGYAKAGPYTVILSKTTLRARRAQPLDLTIVKGDDPATDLGTYLGAAGHAVFIDTTTLQYLHVHPMVRGVSMSHAMSGVAGPFLRMNVPPLPAATYELWFQFRGGSRLYTTPFTIVAR